MTIWSREGIQHSTMAAHVKKNGANGSKWVSTATFYKTTFLRKNNFCSISTWSLERPFVNKNHSLCKIATQSTPLCIEWGGKPKWLP